MTSPAYLDLRALEAYSGIPKRTLRRLQHRKRQPMPVYRVGRAVRVKVAEFDQWMAECCKAAPRPDLSEMAQDFLQRRRSR